MRTFILVLTRYTVSLGRVRHQNEGFASRSVRCFRQCSESVYTCYHFITARKRSLGQDNIFTSICDSFFSHERVCVVKGESVVKGGERVVVEEGVVKEGVVKMGCGENE